MLEKEWGMLGKAGGGGGEEECLKGGRLHYE